MKKFTALFFCIISALCLSACNQDVQTVDAITEELEQHFSVGILLPDVGLGDQSFNDLAIKGLVKARDDMKVLLSYRDLNTSSSLEEGLEELLVENHDVIIGVGYSVQELLEKEAADNPDQRFVLVDTVSDVANIDSITFKEDEGSYLAGVVAALNSTSNVIGFVGGMEDPVIQKFLDGYREGAQSIKPEIEVLVTYANTYSDDKVGAQLASDMIAQNADVLYAAAGYTGVGLLQQAQRENVLAIGVDSDQYFYAEKAVVTSMLKNVDIAIYTYLESLLENPTQDQLFFELGIEEDGVDLAPIRVISNTVDIENQIEQIKNQIPKD